jgi:uncharacterized protein (DUF1015 family)
MVLCPPYDIISSEKQAELYALDSRNAVRLELGREVDRYAEAARLWSEWKADGTIVQEKGPALYLLSQEFEGLDRRRSRRVGVIALATLEGRESGKILPHEKTFPKPKADRLQLLSTTKAQFSPIFCLYDDPSRTLSRIFADQSSTEPALAGEFEGTKIKVWTLTDRVLIRSVQQTLAATQVFIADGHHRYETALEYQRMQQQLHSTHTGEEGYTYTMMYLANISEEGLAVFPIHRVIRGLKDFRAEEFLSRVNREFKTMQVESLQQLITSLRGKKRFSYGVVVQGEPHYLLISLKNGTELVRAPEELRALDVFLLHEYVFQRLFDIDWRSFNSGEHIRYITDEREAVDVVKRGEAQVAFLLNPTGVEQLQAVARAGLTMPQKSTYFFPKVPAGLVMYDLDRW